MYLVRTIYFLGEDYIAILHIISPPLSAFRQVGDRQSSPAARQIPPWIRCSSTVVCQDRHYLHGLLDVLFCLLLATAISPQALRDAGPGPESISYLIARPLVVLYSTTTAALSLLTTITSTCNPI
ncbi:hypothetical protein BDW68DRAFT_46913 [Aspergillus falconensis]